MSGITRRAFSQHELSVATATGHLRFIDRHTRLHVRGYPIDDIDPTRPSDRDDAIYAEQTSTGYVLHVTIADVASHIAKDSPLDKAAQKRVLTIYRPPARDPMFPFLLSEDRFSLEHEQARLGLTISITLNDGYRPTGIAFRRSIIEAECQDYTTASHRMQQPGDDMELLARLMRGIRQHARPPIHPGGSDTTYLDKTGLLRQGDAGVMAASKLVQVAMIFTNNEIAKFFARTDLPFLFRNHLHLPDNAGRAEYQPYDAGHYSLRSDGLVGAYSHCTSPIRRYADLVNQRMMHYSIAVIEAIASELTRFLPEDMDAADSVPQNTDSPPTYRSSHNRPFMPVLWDNAATILQAVFAVHQAQGHARNMAEHTLKDVLGALLHRLVPAAGKAHYLHDAYLQTDMRAQLSAAALEPSLPYSHAELATLASHLNAVQAREYEEVTELNRRNLARWNEKIEDDLATGRFAELGGNAFSGVLRRAAVTGRINDALAQEVASRIHSGAIDLIPDTYSILLLSKEYQNKHWRGLKRLALNTIEHDPMAVNNLFEKALKEGEIHPDTYIAEAILRDSAAVKSLPLLSAAGVEQQIDAALVITYMPELGNREYAAASYSLGYSKKDASRHARFNFIRALAFGELGPLDQTILPTPLYAELGNDKRKRADVLREMTDNMELALRELGPRQRPDGRYSFAYQVFGPGIEHPVIGFVVEDTIELAREKAATRILRNMQFKRAYAQEHPVEIGFPGNPLHVVREAAEAYGWHLHEPERSAIREVERGVFHAALGLDLRNGEMLESHAEGRNKDTALRYAFEQLRDKLHVRGLLPREPRSEGQAVHWVTWSVVNRDGGASR